MSAISRGNNSENNRQFCATTSIISFRLSELFEITFAQKSGVERQSSLKVSRILASFDPKSLAARVYFRKASRTSAGSGVFCPTCKKPVNKFPTPLSSTAREIRREEI